MQDKILVCDLERGSYMQGWYKYIDTIYRENGEVLFRQSITHLFSVGHANFTAESTEGVAPDAPVVVNEAGGKQSDTPYGFHL